MDERKSVHQYSPTPFYKTYDLRLLKFDDIIPMNENVSSCKRKQGCYVIDVVKEENKMYVQAYL